jgi:hypothetical protein
MPKSISEWQDEWTDLHVRERAAFDEVRDLTGPAIRALNGTTSADINTIEESLAAYDRWDIAKKAIDDFFVRFRAARI